MIANSPSASGRRHQGTQIAIQHTSDQRGQALVEMALVVVMLVLLMMGAVEFGRAFMVANMITNAARDGARAAALVPPSARPTAGIISNGDKNVICGQMAADIANVLGAGYCGTTCDPSCGSALCMDIVQPAVGVGDPPLVRATVTGNVPYIFNLVGTGVFAVNRSVTFRDEGR